MDWLPESQMSVLDNEVIKETVAQTEQENVHMRNKAVTLAYFSPCAIFIRPKQDEITA